MFATKNDAVNWIKEFASGVQLEPRKRGKYWYIYDADGFLISEGRIYEMEAAAR